MTTKSDAVVLFLPGLESGPNGRKASKLKKVFPKTICPDLDMSLYRLDKTNSIARSILEVVWNEPSLLLSGLNAVASTAGKKSLEKCCEVAMANVRASSSPVQLVCGSSWGGAVALWLMLTGAWNGPSLLISPALKRALTVQLDEAEATSRMEDVYKELGAKYVGREHLVTVVHGDHDDTVALQDSKELCEKTGFTLIIVPEGDHRLNGYLLHQNNLVRLVEEKLRANL